MSETEIKEEQEAPAAKPKRSRGRKIPFSQEMHDSLERVIAEAEEAEEAEQEEVEPAPPAQAKRSAKSKLPADNEDEPENDEPENFTIFTDTSFQAIGDGFIGLGRGRGEFFTVPLFYADNMFAAQRAARAHQEEVQLEQFPIIQASWTVDGEKVTRRLAPVRWFPATTEEVEAEDDRIEGLRQQKRVEAERRKIIGKLRKLGLSDKELRIIAGDS
jgi:hypothetical protein